VLPFLQVLKSYFKTILIISHLQQIKETAESIIEVANDGTYSKVQA
jgi:DNA repair exonuclease SbcCD ATPase subunit